MSGAADSLSLSTGSGAITLGGLSVKALAITTTGAELLNPGSYTVTSGATFNSTGGVSLSGALTLGPTIFGSASSTVTLGGNTTLDSSAGNSALTLNTVSGAGDTLSLTTGTGALTLGGVTVQALLVTSTGTETVNTGTYTIGTGPYGFANNATLSGTLTLGQDTIFGGVTLGGSTTLNSSAGNHAITLGSVVGGANTLSLSTGSGAVTLGGLSVKALTIATTGGETLNAGAYTVTSGAITFSSSGGETLSGALTLGQATSFVGAVTLGGNTTLTTTNSALTLGAVSGSGDTLSLSTGSGAIALSGATVQALPITSTGAETLNAGLYSIANGAYNFANAVTFPGGTYTLSQGTTFGGAVTLSGDTVINAGANAVTFSSTVNSAAAAAHALTVNSAGVTSFGGSVGATAPLASLTTDAAGSTTFGASLATVKTSGALTLGDPLTLGGNTTLSSAAGNGAISLGAVSGNADTLSLSSGTGALTLGGLNIKTLAITTTGAETLNPGTYTITSGATFNSTKGVSLSGALTFGQPTTLGSATSTVSLLGNATLTTTNTALTFGPISGIGDTLSLTTGTGAISLAGATLQALSVTSTGTETVNAGTYAIGTGPYAFASNATLSGTLTLGQDTSFVGSVTLGGSTTLNSSAGNYAITLGPVAGGANTLSLSTGSGAITLNGLSVKALTIATTGAETLDAGAYTVTSGAVSFASSGGEMLSGALTLGQATSFAGAVTLGGNTTLTTMNAAITLGAVSGGANSLSLSTGSGVITLNGVTVGGLTTTTTGTESLSTGTYAIGNGITPYSFTGPASLSGTLTLDQATTFGGAVTLAGATTIDSNSAVTFGSTINGAQSLTVNSGGITSFAGSIGLVTPLAALATDSAGSVSLAATVGSVKVTGPVAFADPVTLGGNTTINTSAGNGAISLGAVAGASPTVSLWLSSGSGGVTLSGATLGGLSITTTGGATETLQTGTYAIGTGGPYSFAASGGEILSGALTLGQATTFAGAVALAGDTTISSNAAITLGPVSGVGNSLSLVANASPVTLNGAKVGQLQIVGASAETLNAGTYTMGGGAPVTFAATNGENVSGALTLGQDTTFGQSVTLLGNTTLNSSAGNNAITLAAVSGAGLSLSLATGFGAIALNGATVNALPISDNGLETLNAGTYTIGFGAPFTFASSGGVAISGNLIFSQATAFATPTTLSANTTISATGGVTFANGLSGGNALVVTNGATTLDGTIGVGSLSLQAATLDGGTVLTSGGQTYAGAVTLGTATTLSGAAVAFSSSVDAAGGPVALAITGGASFGAAVGGLTPLASLAVTGATTIGANIATVGGGQTYGGAVTLTGDTSLGDSGGGAIAFLGTIGGAHALDVNTAGATSFAAPVQIASLTVANTAGTTALDGGSVTTTGGQTYDNPVTLGAATVLSGGVVTFATIVNSSGAAVALAVSGNASFGAAVGGLLPLQTLAVTGSSALGGDVTTVGGSFTAGQSYGGAVTLTADSSLSASNGSIFLSGTVDGGHLLVLNSPLQDDLDGAVGGITPLTSLTIAASGGELAGGVVHTTGAQLYNGALIVAEDMVLTAPLVTFASDVNSDGRVSALTVNGNASFGAEVGHVIPLARLVVTGTTLIASEIDTTAGQSYGGAVTLTGDARLTDEGGGAISFGGAVDGAHALTVDSAGPISFAGTVGFTTPLTSLTLGDVGTLTIGGGSIATSGGGQTYDGAVVLGGAGATLSDSGGGTISFVGTIDGTAPGAQSLLVSTSGPTSFENSVGATTPLGTLSVIGGGTEFFSGSLFATLGSQFYGSPLSPQGPLILEATGPTSDITIAGVTLLDSGDELSLLAGHDVVVTGVLQNAGSGGIDLVAGWNGSAGFSAGSFSIDSLLAAANGYGQHNGSVFIGGGGQTAGAAVGSALGRFVVAGDNVTVQGSATIPGGFAQIGDGGGIGDIEVAATGTVLVEGGAITGAYAQIGHGGIGASANDAGTVIVGATNITLVGGAGNSYAQIGHGDASGVGTGDQQGAIDVRASGILSLATGTPAPAVIGHATSNGAVSNANVLVVAGALVVDGVTDTLSGGDLFTTESLAPDLAGGAVALAITGGGLTVGAASYAASHPLSLLATGELAINGKDTAGGSVTLVGGWDGTAGLPALGGAFDSAAVLSSTANYGAGGQGVSLGGGGIAAAGIAVAGPVTLTAGTTLQTSSGNDIVLAGTIDGAQALTLAAPGTVTLGGSIGATTPLASLTVTDPNGIAMLGPNAVTIATTGGQTYGATLALGGNLTLSHGAGALSLASVTAGGDTLTITGTGATIFNAAVTAQSLSVAGPATLAGGSITTFAGQTYGGAVTLGGDALLTDPTTVSFLGSIDGAHTLEIINAATNFDGAIGATTPLARSHARLHPRHDRAQWRHGPHGGRAVLGRSPHGRRGHGLAGGRGGFLVERELGREPCVSDHIEWNLYRRYGFPAGDRRTDPAREPRYLRRDDPPRQCFHRWRWPVLWWRAGVRQRPGPRQRRGAHRQWRRRGDVRGVHRRVQPDHRFHQRHDHFRGRARRRGGARRARSDAGADGVRYPHGGDEPQRIFGADRRPGHQRRADGGRPRDLRAGLCRRRDLRHRYRAQEHR